MGFHDFYQKSFHNPCSCLAEIESGIQIPESIEWLCGVQFVNLRCVRACIETSLSAQIVHHEREGERSRELKSSSERERERERERNRAREKRRAREPRVSHSKCDTPRECNLSF